MKASLKGWLLPESHDDARELLRDGLLMFHHCGNCLQSLYRLGAASTPEGWRETQISGICEPCFNEITAFEEDA